MEENINIPSTIVHEIIIEENKNCEQIKSIDRSILLQTNNFINEKNENNRFYSNWFCTEYTNDFGIALREQEQKLVIFNFQSPQSSYRKCLIDLLILIAEYEKLNRTTVHLGIYLLDIFMDNHDIYEERLKLVALVCLFLASKMEERECNVPKLSDLNGLIKNQYPLHEYLSLEFMVLNWFDWDLVVPTTAHFTEFYLSALASSGDEYKSDKTELMVLEDDLEVEQNFIDNLTTQMIDFIWELQNITLSDTILMHKYPSKISAACIGAARKLLKLKIIWPSILQNVTKYKYPELEKIINRLIYLKSNLTNSVSQHQTPLSSICINIINKTEIQNKRKAHDSGYLTDMDLEDGEVVVEEVYTHATKKQLIITENI